MPAITPSETQYSKFSLLLLEVHSILIRMYVMVKHSQVAKIQINDSPEKPKAVEIFTYKVVQ